MKAVLCPVCEGDGEVIDYGGIGSHTGSTPYEKQCHGCRGKGWVEVQESEKIEFEPYGNNTHISSDYSKCPHCGDDRYSPAGTGCPYGSHYGTYC